MSDDKQREDDQEQARVIGSGGRVRQRQPGVPEIMGYSRDGFYRFRELYAEHGGAGLREISRRKPTPQNRGAPEIEEAVVKLATDNPACGQKRVSNELKKRGLFVSPGGMRSIWLRHDL